MSSWYASGSRNDAPSPLPAVTEEKPPKRIALYLLRKTSKNRSGSGKQQQQQPAANNNNIPFMIHCQIGKEIKHICSNCRGADPHEGEWRGGLRFSQRRKSPLGTGIISKSISCCFHLIELQLRETTLIQPVGDCFERYSSKRPLPWLAFACPTAGCFSLWTGC